MSDSLLRRLRATIERLEPRVLGTFTTGPLEDELGRWCHRCTSRRPSARCGECGAALCTSSACRSPRRLPKYQGGGALCRRCASDLARRERDRRRARPTRNPNPKP